MPPSWRAGLVTAFPVPDDKRRKKKRPQTLSKSDIWRPARRQYRKHHLIYYRALLVPPPSPEIRTRIYLLILFPPPRTPYDPKPTAPTNSTLAILRTSSQLHAETTHLLYTHTPFPLFPIQTFPPLPTPLLIPPRQRPLIKSLHLRLGNSWTAPPKSWRVSKLLCRALPKFISLRILKVFVEVDPSEPMFEKYRVNRDFYTEFAGMLMRDVLRAVPQVECVEVGGYGFVNVRGPLVTRVVDVVKTEGRRLVWSEKGEWRIKARSLQGSEALLGEVKDGETWPGLNVIW